MIRKRYYQSLIVINNTIVLQTVILKVTKQFSFYIFFSLSILCIVKMEDFLNLSVLAISDFPLVLVFILWDLLRTEKRSMKWPSAVINSVSNKLSHPFPPNLQNIITPKPLELGTWSLRQCSSPPACHVRCQVSGVRCQVSGVRCHMSGVTC